MLPWLTVRCDDDSEATAHAVSHEVNVNKAIHNADTNAAKLLRGIYDFCRPASGATQRCAGAAVLDHQQQWLAWSACVVDIHAGTLAVNDHRCLFREQEHSRSAGGFEDERTRGWLCCSGRANEWNRWTDEWNELN